MPNAKETPAFAVVVANTVDELPDWLPLDLADEARETLTSRYFNRSMMFIKLDTDVVGYVDGGEPEDNTFARDWDWVAGALHRAYSLGVTHGKVQSA